MFQEQPLLAHQHTPYIYHHPPQYCRPFIRSSHQPTVPMPLDLTPQSVAATRQPSPSHITHALVKVGHAADNNACAWGILPDMYHRYKTNI
jgi:hypothetical protein